MCTRELGWLSVPHYARVLPCYSQVLPPRTTRPEGRSYPRVGDYFGGGITAQLANLSARECISRTLVKGAREVFRKVHVCVIDHPGPL